MIASACLDEFELAMLLDGKGKRRERGRWLAHLDACHDCRSVLAEAAMYLEDAAGDEDRTSPWKALARMLRGPVVASAALVLVVAAIAGIVVDPMQWLSSGEAVNVISSVDATTPLFELTSESYASDLWQSRERGLGFSASLRSQQLAFLTGVHLVDLRVAVQEGRRSEASAVLDELEPLVENAASVVALRQALDTTDSLDASHRAITAIEERAVATQEASSLSMGIWCESARLAAAAGAVSFFAEAPFRQGLAAFRELELSEPISSKIRTIDELAASDVEATDLGRLQQELRALILLGS